MEEFMRKHSDIATTATTTAAGSGSMNCSMPCWPSTNTSNLTSLSWQEQAISNPWGTSTSTKETRWVTSSSNNSSGDSNNDNDKEEKLEVVPSSRLTNPFSGPVLPHKTFGQPKLTLGNWYYKRYNIVLSNDCFDCTNNGEKHILKWTCTFTCPLTGNTFVSGQYAGADETRYFQLQEEQEDNIAATAVDVWYNTKKEAEHAAAARALDCLNFREKEVLKTNVVEYHSYCKETPIIPSIPYPPYHHQNSNEDVSDENRHNINSSSTTAAIMEVELDFCDFTIATTSTAVVGSSNTNSEALLSFNKSANLLLRLEVPPKQSLVQWYTLRYKIELRTSDSFQCKNDRNPAQQLLKWTCTFTCPLTKNIFKSGQYNKNYTVVNYDSNNNDKEDVAIVWYKTKKEAEHAAAARALDCFTLMDATVDNTTTQQDDACIYYCKETPMLPRIPYPPQHQRRTNTHSTSRTTRTDDTMDVELLAASSANADYRMARTV